MSDEEMTIAQLRAKYESAKAYVEELRLLLVDKEIEHERLSRSARRAHRPRVEVSLAR